MDFLGVGPLELAFIVLIALIILGPKDMVKAGRTVGKTLRQIITSPMWKAVRNTGQSIQELPNRLIREAGLEEDLQTLDKEMKDTANSIDPRRISRSFSEHFDPETLTPPEPAPPTYEPDAPSVDDPAAETSPENPQV